MTYDSRVRPHQIRPADDTGALVDPGVYGMEVVEGGPFGKRVSGLTPVVAGLTSDDMTVSINPNGDGTLDLSVTGGGGGGGTGNDRRWNVGPSELSIDEFDDDSLAGAWGRVDGTGAASGNASWTEGADTLTSQRLAANTSNTFQGIVRPIIGSGAAGAVAAGDAWFTCLTQLTPPNTNFSLSGIVISDGNTHGAGKQVIAEVLNAAGTTSTLGGTFYTVAATNWTTTGGTIGTSKRMPGPGIPMFLRLAYLGSNVWRTDLSPNGVVWTKAGTVTVASFTPAYVGFYTRDAASGTECVTAYEFLRRVTGVT